jgi:hypothetical protein
MLLELNAQSGRRPVVEFADQHKQRGIEREAQGAGAVWIVGDAPGETIGDPAPPQSGRGSEAPRRPRARGPVPPRGVDRQCRRVPACPVPDRRPRPAPPGWETCRARYMSRSLSVLRSYQQSAPRSRGRHTIPPAPATLAACRAGGRRTRARGSPRGTARRRSA